MTIRSFVTQHNTNKQKTRICHWQYDHSLHSTTPTNRKPKTMWWTVRFVENTRIRNKSTCQTCTKFAMYIVFQSLLVREILISPNTYGKNCRVLVSRWRCTVRPWWKWFYDSSTDLEFQPEGPLPSNSRSEIAKIKYIWQNCLDQFQSKVFTKSKFQKMENMYS